MEHLTEAQLNEYLDRALAAPARARAETHLTECPDCRARLASLQAVSRTLAALLEEMPGRDLSPSILRALPRSFSGLAWHLAFAVQAGLSLGLLLLFAPFLTDRIAGIVQAMAVRIATAEVKLPALTDLYFSLPDLRLPHPPFIPSLPITITPANSPIWLILGIAAFLLFVVGNFSLIFHSSSESRK
jgi:hypothetical protein